MENAKRAKGRDKMSNLGNTQYFKVPQEQKLGVEEILERVYQALAEKGYNPVNQIVGYIMSGDPTYITSHNNARSLIMKVERDELIEETVKYYINNKLKYATAIQMGVSLKKLFFVAKARKCDCACEPTVWQGLFCMLKGEML